jgi:cell division protein FtsZ
VAPQRLDPFGRAAPVRNPAEEKVLDIPVFLNRKAN